MSHHHHHQGRLRKDKNAKTAAWEATRGGVVGAARVIPLLTVLFLILLWFSFLDLPVMVDFI